MVSAESKEKPKANVFAALPLGGRIRIDPWNDQLRMLNSKPVGGVVESERMPFQITPLVFYLTRQRDNSSPEASGVAESASGTKP